MIAKQLGETDKAKHYLTQALSLNPFFSPLGATEAKNVLEELLLSVKAHEEGQDSHEPDPRA